MSRCRLTGAAISIDGSPSVSEIRRRRGLRRLSENWETRATHRDPEQRDRGDFQKLAQLQHGLTQTIWVDTDKH